TKINNINCGLVSDKTVIDSISGPTSLKKNQIGSWTVAATPAEGKKKLNYAVFWGADGKGVPTSKVMATSKLKWYSSPKFRHYYKKEGTFNGFFYAATSRKDIAEKAFEVCVGSSAICDKAGGVFQVRKLVDDSNQDVVILKPGKTNQKILGFIVESRGVNMTLKKFKVKFLPNATSQLSSSITKIKAMVGGVVIKELAFSSIAGDTFAFENLTVNLPSNTPKEIYVVVDTQSSIPTTSDGQYEVSVNAGQVAALNNRSNKLLTGATSATFKNSFIYVKNSSSLVSFFNPVVVDNTSRKLMLGWYDSNYSTGLRYDLKFRRATTEVTALNQSNFVGSCSSVSNKYQPLYFCVKSIDIPTNTASSSDYNVTACRAGSTADCDGSAPFAIGNVVPPPSSGLTVNLPAAGTTWAQGSSHLISWTDTKEGTSTRQYDVYVDSGNVGLVGTALNGSSTLTWANVGQLYNNSTAVTGSHVIQVCTHPTTSDPIRCANSGNLTISGTNLTTITFTGTIETPLAKDATTSIAWSDSAVPDSTRSYQVKVATPAGVAVAAIGATTSNKFYWANVGKKANSSDYLNPGTYAYQVCTGGTGGIPARCSATSSSFVYSNVAGPDTAFVVSSPAAGANWKFDEAHDITWTDPQGPTGGQSKDYYVTAWQGNERKGTIGLFNVYNTTESTRSWAKVGKLNDTAGSYLAVGNYRLRVSTTSDATDRYGESAQFTISASTTAMNSLRQLASIEEALRSLLKLFK
ncbi:MAG: hypothetical protein WCO03_01810, partial [bacterium]